MALIVSEPSAAAGRLTPNRVRLLEAMLFLLEEAERRNTYLTQYEIVKSLFVGDTKHLNAHGRPITFDNYVAMENGPVGSEGYDMTKPSFDWHARMGIEGPPWKRVASPSDGRNAFRYIRNPDRVANLRKLSKTDVQALSEALTLVKQLRFGGTKDFTHRNPSYVAAWKDGGKAFDMDYRLLMEVPDDELMEEIIDVSRHT